MGQYILCMGELAKQPYTIREVGLRIYSGEELCYYIFHNLALIDDSFVSEELVRFIDLELDMHDVATRLRKMSDRQAGNTSASLNQLLIAIMREMKYYNEEEMEQFTQKLEQYRRMSEIDRLMARADALLERKKYTAAIMAYEEYLDLQGRKNQRNAGSEIAWQHLAVVYLRMYLYDQAVECLLRAYEVRGSEEILKQLYFLSIMKDITLPADFFTIESPETLSMWQDEYKAAREGVDNAMETSRLSMLLKKDSVRREQELVRYLQDMKQEYRMSE